MDLDDNFFGKVKNKTNVDKDTLVDLAKRKGFEIYQRKLNVSGSKILVVKL